MSLLGFFTLGFGYITGSECQINEVLLSDKQLLWDSIGKG